LLPVTEDRELADGSGFGGVPHLPAGSEHPACPRCGRPLSQFLQLRLEDLPEDNRPAGEGLLQLFYCTTEGDEDGACEFELEAYSEFSQATVIRLVPAGFGHPSAVSPRFPPKRIVDWTRQPEPPDWCEMGFRGLRVDEDLAEALSEAGLPTSNDKLGGWPSWVQDVRYVECRKCHERMRYLFQVASEDHLDYMFGDAGTAWLCQCQTHPDEMAFYWDCS
jgi:uncharacterized protein YwqG